VGRVRAVLAIAIFPIAVVAIPAPRLTAADPVPVAANPAAAGASLRIGMPKSMFSGLSDAIVQVGAVPFKQMFEKQTGLKGEVDVTKDFADTTARLRTKKLDLAVYHGFEYAWVRDNPELVPLLVTVPGSKIQACLVVNAKSEATGPESLKGACVVVPATTKAYCHLYHERLIAKLPEGCCGAAKPDDRSLGEVLEAVASNKCDAVLVDKAALDAYKRLVPGAGPQLKILAQSEPFPSAVIVYRKGVFDAKAEKNLREGLIQGMATPQGDLLKQLWKLDGFVEISPKYQKELDASLKAYPAPKEK
jgi:ABC-type phosphate/phosphonate transport system substrate-binding protein